jgi:TonB family protein
MNDDTPISGTLAPGTVASGTVAPGTVAPTVTSSLAERRARQYRMFVVFCAVSLTLHLFAFAAYAFWPHGDKPAVDLDAAVVKTRLVKLGKTRDDKLLPRLPTAPAPPAADKKAPPKPDDAKDAPSPDSSKKPTAAELLEKLKQQENRDVNDVIKQRVGEQTDEGKEDGDKDGVDLEGEIKATYFARVAAHIRKHMEVSSVLSDEERIKLRGELFLRINDDGTVADAKMQKGSGSNVFDNDIVTAAKRSSPLPAPPPQVQALASKGIALQFCPVSCS